MTTMKAGPCPSCRRMKVVVHFGKSWVIRTHSAEKDLSRFNQKERWNGPILTMPCPGSRSPVSEPITL